MQRWLFLRSPLFVLAVVLLPFTFAFTAFCLTIRSVYAQDAVVFSGRVTEAGSGNPIAGVDILLYEAYGSGIWPVGETDSSGYYTITEAVEEGQRDFFPGSFRVRFSSEEPYVPVFYDNVTTHAEAARLNLDPATPTTGINATLTAGGEVRGKLTDENNQPPAGAEFYSIDFIDGDGDSIRKHLQIDAAGFYTASGILPGSYRLYAQPIGGDYFHVAEYYPNALKIEDAQPLDISAGEVITGVNFSFLLGGSISGTLTSDTLGPTISNPEIVVYDEAGEVFTNWRLYSSSSVQIASHLPPNFIVANLPPGNYRLRLADGQAVYRPEFYDNQPTLDSATALSVTAGEMTTLTAVLAYIPQVAAIATSSVLSDMILLTLQYNPIPRFTSNNGVGWREVAKSPWVDGEADTSVPSLGLALRLEPGLPQRIIVLRNRALYRSGDNGVTWTQYFLSDCDSQHFSNILASPQAPTRLHLLHTCVIPFAGNYMYSSNLYISHNSGLDWEKQGSKIPSDAAVAEIQLSPVITDRLYIFVGGQWMQSDNSGASWTTRGFPVVSLTLDPQDAQWLYGLTPFDTVVIVERIGMRSEDGGATWVAWEQQPCPFGLNAVPGSGNVQLMAHPTQSKTLFVRCDQGLYRSNDGGDSWTQLETFPGQLLAPDYGHTGRILWARDDGLWASTDQGDSWQNIMPDYAAASQPEWNYLPGITKK